MANFIKKIVSTSRTLRQLHAQAISQDNNSPSFVVIADLTSKGFTRINTVDGGFAYQAPNQDYINYQDRTQTTHSLYSPETFYFDSNGQLLKDVSSAPIVSDAYGHTTIRSIKDQVVQDFIAGTVTSDFSTPTTNLAIDQIDRDAIKRGKPPVPNVILQQQAQAQVQQNADALRQRNENVTSVTNRDGVFVSTLRNPTYESTYNALVDVQDQRSQDFYNQLSNGESARVHQALLDNPHAVLTGVNSNEVKMINNPFVNGVVNNKTLLNNQNGLISIQKTTNPFVNGADNYDNGLLPDGTIDSTFPYAYHPSNTIGQMAKEKMGPTQSLAFGAGGEIFNLGRSLVSGAEQFLTIGFPQLLDFTQSPAQTSLRKQSQVKSLLGNQDFQNFAVAGTFALAQLTPFAPLVDAGTIGYFGGSLAGKSQGDYLSKNYEGIGADIVDVTLLSLPLVKELQPSNIFLNIVNKAEPAKLNGEVLFSMQEELPVFNKGDLVSTSPGVDKTVSNVIDVETKLERQAVPKLIRGFGKTPEGLGLGDLRNFIGDKTVTSLPDGSGVINIQGKGLFKNYFLNTFTDEFGGSKTVVYKQGFKPTSFFDIRPEPYIKPVKSFSFSSDPGMFIGEPLNLKSEETTSTFPDLTIRNRFDLMRQEIMPTSRKGYVAKGQVLSLVNQRVGVGTTTPYFELDLVQSPKQSVLEFGSTEYSIVDYPVKMKDTTITKSGKGSFADKSITFSDLSNFKEPTGGIVINKDLVNTKSNGQYIAELDKIELSSNHLGIAESNTPTLYHEMAHKFFGGDVGNKLSVDELMTFENEVLGSKVDAVYKNYENRGYHSSDIQEEVLADTIANFVKDQQKFKGKFPLFGDILSKKLGNEVTLVQEAGLDVHVNARKPAEFTSIAESNVKQVFEINYEKLGKRPKANLDLVKKSGKFVNKFPDNVDAKFYSNFDFGETKPFLGKSAESFDVAGSKEFQSLKAGLDQFDPLGLGGDRIRQNFNTDLVNQVQVGASGVKFEPYQGKILQDALPNGLPKSFRLGIFPVNTLSSSIRQNSKSFSGTLGSVRLNSLGSSFSVQNNKQLNLQRPKLIHENKLVTQNKLLSLQQPKILQLNRSLVQNKVLTLNETKQLTRQQIKQLTQQQTKTLQNTSTGSPGEFGFVPGFDIPSFNRNIKLNKRSSLGSTAFDVFVRESRPKSGKNTKHDYKLDRQPLPYNKAFNLGENVADNSDIRSFYLKPNGSTTQADDPIKNNLFKFRKSKSGKYFTEKSKYAIDSPGEREDITAKGLNKLFGI